MTQNVIALSGIYKSLGKKRILSNITLSIRGGEVVGITGPVGAGKSSLLHILTSLMTPDKGAVTLFHSPLPPSDPRILQRINYAASNQRLSGYASVWENLTTFALLYGISNVKPMIIRLWNHFHMPHDLLTKKVYRLSSGENSFVNFCKSLINDPDLLLFDEITAHMDSVLAKRLQEYIRLRNDKYKVTLIVSQQTEELTTLCTRVIVLNKGILAFDGEPDRLTPSAIIRYYA